MRHQRAILDEEKIERHQAILDAALALFTAADGQLASVAKVAQKAGLAKGTVYLYFRTKEEIFLSILAADFEAWFDWFDELLEMSETLSMARVVDHLADFVIDRPDFLQLASLSNSILEQNIDSKAALDYKKGLARRLLHSGALLDDRLVELPDQSGALMLARSYALIIGLWQVVQPPVAIRDLIEQEDELAIFRQQFADEVKPALLALWQGSMINQNLK